MTKWFLHIIIKKAYFSGSAELIGVRINLNLNDTVHFMVWVDHLTSWKISLVWMYTFLTIPTQYESQNLNFQPKNKSSWEHNFTHLATIHWDMFKLWNKSTGILIISTSLNSIAAQFLQRSSNFVYKPTTQQFIQKVLNVPIQSMYKYKLGSS